MIKTKKNFRKIERSNKMIVNGKLCLEIISPWKNPHPNKLSRKKQKEKRNNEKKRTRKEKERIKRKKTEVERKKKNERER